MQGRAKHARRVALRLSGPRVKSAGRHGRPRERRRTTTMEDVPPASSWPSTAASVGGPAMGAVEVELAVQDRRRGTGDEESVHSELLTCSIAVHEKPKGWTSRRSS